MKLVKRISTTLFSGIDQALGRIENHDALVKASIEEQRQALAAATVQRNRVSAKIKQLTETIAELEVTEKKWQERALAAAKLDQEKALACLQRRKATNAHIQQQQTILQQYQQTLARIEEGLQRTHQQILKIENKHEEMRARETNAAIADRGLSSNLSSSRSMSDLEQGFERWEIKIAEHEVHAGLNEGVAVTGDEYDSLSLEFSQQEARQELLTELSDLQQQANKESSDAI